MSSDDSDGDGSGSNYFSEEFLRQAFARAAGLSNGVNGFPESVFPRVPADLRRNVNLVDSADFDLESDEEGHSFTSLSPCFVQESPVLAREDPLAVVISVDKQSRACAYCLEFNPDLKSIGALPHCVRCKEIYYCCRDCQQADWAIHRYECGKMKLDSVEDHIRLVARVLICLKIKKLLPSPAFNGRKWDSLIEHDPEIRLDKERMNEFHRLHNHLKRFTKFHDFKKSVIFTTYCKVVINSITIHGGPCYDYKVGCGLYIGLSAQNHSCLPDCFIHFEGRKAILRPLNPDVKEYSTALTITYVDMLDTSDKRKAKLRALYYFDCNCSLCSNKQWDSFGNSVACGSGDSNCLLGTCPLTSSDTLSCFMCKKKLAMSPAKARNEITKFCLLNELSPFGGADFNTRLQSQLHISQQFEFLGSLNFAMMSTMERMVKLMDLASASPLMEGVDKVIAIELLPCYRFYLPFGHPELATRMYLACVRLLNEDKSKTILPLIREKIEEAVRRYFVKTLWIDIEGPFAKFGTVCPRLKTYDSDSEYEDESELSLNLRKASGRAKVHCDNIAVDWALDRPDNAPIKLRMLYYEVKRWSYEKLVSRLLIQTTQFLVAAFGEEDPMTKHTMELIKQQRTNDRDFLNIVSHLPFLLGI